MRQASLMKTSRKGRWDCSCISLEACRIYYYNQSTATWDYYYSPAKATHNQKLILANLTGENSAILENNLMALPRFQTGVAVIDKTRFNLACFLDK